MAASRCSCRIGRTIPDESNQASRYTDATASAVATNAHCERLNTSEICTAGKPTVTTQGTVSALVVAVTRVTPSSQASSSPASLDPS